MELIIDANVLISALISQEGKTREIIFAYNIKFYAPEFLFTEIEEHKEEILKKSRLSDDEFDLALKLLKTRIILVPFTDFRQFVSRAIRASPDPDDIEYIALAMSKGISIWTDDKALKKQDKVKIISTSELIEGFEYPHNFCQNPQKSTLNSCENMGYSKSSIENLN